MKSRGRGFASTLNSLLYLYSHDLLSHAIQRSQTRKMAGVSMPQTKHKTVAEDVGFHTGVRLK
jgi:hypothetical protein